MKYSEFQVKQEIDRLSGEGFLFSIFPTETVRANMAAGLVTASDAEVERLWTAYQKGSAQGIPAYSKAAGGGNAAAWLTFLSSETGYDRGKIAAYLNGVEKAVKEQGWDWKWLDPAAATAAGEPITAGQSITKALGATGEAVGGFLKPSLDPVTNLVKYAAVALVAGAVIYGVYHGSKFFKAKRRKGK